MKQVWNWIKNNPNRAMFLVPILLVAGISISHVVTWYDMANPINWAIYLSIAIEVGAITALIAASNRIKGGIWFMFGIVTFIQMVGNIFYSYKEIDANGELFKSWVELTGPVWELLGTEITDVVGMKRWLAFLEGGLLPIISLTSLHFFVKYEDPNSPKEKKISPKETVKDEKIGIIEDPNSPKETEDSPKTDLQKEADRVWEKVKELKKEGKLTEPTEEDIKNEPTALANSKYRNEIEEEDLSVWDNTLMDGLEEEESDLVEEEVLDTQAELEKQMNKEVSETVKNVEEETLGKVKKDIQIRNGGEELGKTWNNIVKKRKTNNGITRLGE
jgi:hypothetical protein